MASKEELALLLKRPVYLERNSYQHFYHGESIAANFGGIVFHILITSLRFDLYRGASAAVDHRRH